MSITVRRANFEISHTRNLNPDIDGEVSNDDKQHIQDDARDSLLLSPTYLRQRLSWLVSEMFPAVIRRS